VEYSVEPPRGAIHARIEQRFERMLDAGLLDEVRGLMARGDLSLQTPSMRAVGYRQVWQHLCGDVEYAAMVANAVAATRQLAKRQLTWLRSWAGKTVLNDPAEAGGVDAILQSLEAERIVRRSKK
jgi:tRNA dimethylallyltransferase